MRGDAEAGGEGEPNIFEGVYLAAELPDGSQETYLGLTPPPRVSDGERLRTIDAFVVLDCSGSMSGHRMRAANQALQELYACPQVASLTVIRFGCKVAKPQTFHKSTKGGDEDRLPPFLANLGSTMFTPPLQELEACLRQRASKSGDELDASEPLAVFLSDGACHDNPKDTISALGESLNSLRCPLMSVAITTDVRPDVMVAIADMCGDLPFLVIHDNQPEQELAGRLLENLPLDGSHETVRVAFVDKRSNAVVESHERRFSRNGALIELVAPRQVPFADLQITASLFEGTALLPVAVRLRKIGDEPEEDPTRTLSDLGQALLCIARGITGALIKGEVPREEAEARVIALRERFLSHIGDRVAEQKAQETADGLLSMREQQTERDARRKAQKAVVVEVQQAFNKVLQSVGREDMRAVLEAYSQQTLTAKHNKRLGQIARNNASCAQDIVSNDIASKILASYEHHGDKDREMATCLLWLCNPYDSRSKFATMDQGDWVGRAVFVVPGRVAALNCWRMEKVLIRPLTITKSAIPLIRVSETDGRRRAEVSGTGYAEFNACLPMIRPGEHVGAARLAIHCMKNTTAGRAALADMVCGSGELYDGAMVNSIYTTAVLSSLERATSQADFEGVLCALLTCLDLANAGGSKEYWEGIFQRLTGDHASKFIASKDMDSLPDVARAFLPIVCTDVAFGVSEEVVRSLCAMLLIRTTLDQTSQQLGIDEALGVDSKRLDKLCKERAVAATDEELTAIMDGGGAAAAATLLQAALHSQDSRSPGKAGAKRLHTWKVALIYGLHMALRRNGLAEVSQLVDKIMAGEGEATLVGALQEASAGNTADFANELFGCSDGQAALADLLVVCCMGQSGKEEELEKHDGKYNAALFDSLEQCGGPTREGLHALAAKVREEFLLTRFRCAVSEVHFDRHKLQVIRTFALRARKFLQDHPWEAHSHQMPFLTLGWSTDERTFLNRPELWTALQDGWYHASDLDELLSLTKESVQDFDFDVWKATHRHFLPGYHMYSQKNLSLSGADFSAYLSRMKQDLEDHYAGRNGPLYRRQFTDAMRAWVEPYSRHIFQESRIASALDRAARSTLSHGGAQDAQKIVDEVWAQFSELDALPADRRAARRQHIERLATEALQRNRAHNPRA